MKFICRLAIVSAASLWAQAALANPIFYQVENLAGQTWQYVYTVENQTSAPIEEFTVWFDLGRYENLVITGSPSVDWDGLEAQPDPNLPDDGFADWLAFGLPIDVGETLGGFSVAFDWLGAGTPGSQFFQIVDPLTFAELSSGFTQPLPSTTVAEPGSALLLALGAMLLVVLRRRVRVAPRDGSVVSRVGPMVFAGLLLAPLGDTLASVEDLAVMDRQLQSSQRVGRSHFDYTYTITVSNAGGVLDNVVATVASLSADTEIIEGEVVLGSLSAGAAISTDTFTLRQNRRVLFDPEDLVWTFTADEVVSNQVPLADAGDDASTQVGVTVTLDGSGSSDPDGDDLDFFWTLSVPSGSNAALSDPASPTPQFLPDVAGTYVATLAVSDGNDSSVPDDVTVIAVFTGDNPPSIVSTPVTSASVGEPYGYDVQAMDPDIGDALTYSLQLAPAGMTIDPVSGLITWVPEAAGAADVDVLVQDTSGATDRQIYLILVNNGAGDQPPTLSPIADQTTVTLRTMMALAVGDDPEGEALRYGLSESPAGMAINPVTGELTWTPSASQVGVFPATVTVADPGGQMAARSFEINVLAESPNNPPEIAPVSDQMLNALDTLALTLSATDPDAADILTFSLGGAPDGLQFDPRNGALSWATSPADAGTVTLTATVTDNAGDSDSTTFDVTVAEPPLPPAAVDDAYAVDRHGVLQVGAPGVLGNDSDPNGDPLSAEQRSDVSLGTLDAFAADGSFTYTPPPTPPIDVAMSLQCQSTATTSTDAMTIAVADIDNDGQAEIVGIRNVSPPTSVFFILDAATCEPEVGPLVLPVSTYGLLHSNSPLTLVNLDADPELEIVATRAGFPQGGADDSHLVALNPDGSLVWGGDGGSETFTLDPNIGGNNGTRQYSGKGATVADLNGDGSPELLMTFTAINNPSSFATFFGAVIAYRADGSVLWEYQGPPQGGDADGKPLLVVDLDLDGTLEIIHHTSVIDHHGNLEFLLPADLTLDGGTAAPHLSVAPANLDTDPFPELIARDSNNLYLFQHDGQVLSKTPFAIRPNGAVGDITVAELDGTPGPEFVFMNGVGNGNTYGLEAFDVVGSSTPLLWSHRTGSDFLTSAIGGWLGSGVTAFDFDRDGIDELVIQHPRFGAGTAGLFIFDGSDGSLVDSAHQGVNSGINRFTTIADVDGDGAAEIVSNLAVSGLFRIQVWEGAPGNPFAPARPIWNQWIYQPTHVGVDGSVPAYPQPQWLIPGLNTFHAAPVVPFEDPGSTDSFDYRADDGTAVSNDATVRIAITNVNAPVIVSTPPAGASPGFAYEYGALATDGDFGDLLTWTLLDGPDGMVISEFGIVTWTPDETDLGSVHVQIVVTDAQGNTDQQGYDIAVVPPVSVPQLAGLDAAGAAAALVDAGLAVGSVTQAFSLAVPEGEVISQSVAPGGDSAAGAFINYVVSLGPQPIFMPDLVGLSRAVAEATLDSLSLVVGSVVFVNDDAPAGVVIAQEHVFGAQLAVDAPVDVTVSGGPALALTVDAQLIGNGESFGFQASFFDTLGNPAAPPGDLQMHVIADPGADGTVPAVVGQQVVTAADTRGGYRLEVSSTGLGVTRSAEFQVSATFAGDGAQAAYAALSASLNRLDGIYNALAGAIVDNDLPAIQGLATQLAGERGAIDLDALAFTGAAVPETGFLPDSPPGFPTSSDEAMAFAIPGMRAALTESLGFLSRLNPGVARDDDLRNRYLNNLLATEAAQFSAIELTPRSAVARAGGLYGLLSVGVPELLVADADAMLAALGDAGLLARAGTPAEAYRQIALAEEAAVRPVFFTLGGMATASSIRTRIIKDFYVPIVKKIAVRMQNLVAEGLIKSFTSAQEIPGIVTGASLSFHAFELGQAIIEAETAAPAPDGNIVFLIGPTLLADLADALSGVSGVSFTTVKAAKESVDKVKKAAQDAQGALEGGFRQLPAPDAVANGCVFSNVPGCRQLGYADGLPTVYTDGGFPAPVLVVQYDAVTGRLSLGNFLFFPKAED